MNEFVRSSHKVFKIKYHFFVLSAEKVKQICKDIENRFHIIFETTGFDEDHVHFLIELLTTTYSPAKIF